MVSVERGPVSVFARALKDSSEVYQDPRAAAAAGFSGIPVPPTFPFSMAYWGEFPEIQEEGELQREGESVPSNPLWDLMGQLGPGLIMHGEQRFEYHQPVAVGGLLHGEDVISDVYQRESDTHVMTFVVTETTWIDASTGDPVVTAWFNLVHRVRKPCAGAA